MEEQEVVDKAMSIPGATFPQEVAFLYRMALQVPKDTFSVELGTYLGRTLVALAAAAKEKGGSVISIDNYSYPEPCSLEEVKSNLASVGLRGEFGAPPVYLIQGDSRERPTWVTDIGLLFVDSHHIRSHFDAEMDIWLDHVQVNGIVVCHDYDSPTWLEMTKAIQNWFFTPQFDCLGSERRMIAFRKLYA